MCCFKTDADKEAHRGRYHAKEIESPGDLASDGKRLQENESNDSKAPNGA